ncbi:MAG: VCBS repeat-containing protein, partial [Bacteroidetes bacterium]|nr:VCBS repeat-containing protein [Bacteroidota bacterium]
MIRYNYSLARRIARGLLAGSFLCAFTGCAVNEHREAADRLARGSANLEDGTAAMVEMLTAIADTTDRYPQINAHANRARVVRLKSIPLPESEKDRISYRLQLARELLNAGASLEAAELYEQVLSAATQRADLLDPSDRLAVRDMAAIAWMRVGEQDNGIDNPVLDRNLWPIQGAGVHRFRRGAERAAAHYSALLSADPSDLNSRWLLNVARMALGDPPDSIPDAWRLPRVLAEADIGRFTDRAPSAGVDIEGRSGGLIMEDFDGDGLLDLLAASWGLRDQIQLFINRGDGTFENRTEAAGLTGLVSGLNLVHADYDNDGDFDVYVLRGAWLGMGHPNSLLRNNGDGTFSDVTRAAGILDPQPSHSAGWSDFDGDGDLDLFVGNESTDPDNPRPSRLYRNEGDGTFRDVARDVGLAITTFVKGVAWGDYNDDGRPDLYVSNLAEPNLLFRNDGSDEKGGWHFEEVGQRAGVQAPDDSFPTWFWDVDQDGRLDLFVSGWRATVGDVAAELLGRPFRAEPPRLYRHLVDGTFED